MVDMSRTKQVNIRLTPQEYKELQKLRKQMRRTASDAVRILIQDRIAELEAKEKNEK